MESRTQLDHALFQLTPTRTRCDLVIFAGKKSEKLASGLLEPFLSHLKSAKDQIVKGGYSITLRPVSSDATWFTKATLERFVRFVSTPEVLERFVTIETEIDQIKDSIQSNEHKQNGTAQLHQVPDASTKSQVEPPTTGSADAEPEEKPKIRLQRVLESRKAILKKEQAMAYARALVAGFEIEYLHDLVSFSEAFGALRLRDACINFMELCKKKNDDKMWVDEVAALQAYSGSELSYFGTPGILLSAETNDLVRTGLPKTVGCDTITSHGSLGTMEDDRMESNVQVTEGVAQVPTWAKNIHPPPYINNHAQGPPFQQIPPYPGYVFPGMQFSSQYQSNMPWPSNFQDLSVYPDRDFKHGHRYKSFSKRKQKSKGIETDSLSDSIDEQEQEPSLSSDKQIDHKKHSKKHSSRKVAIRNINYIASTNKVEEDNSASESASSDEEEYVDTNSLKLQVEAAVGSLKRHHKPAPQKGNRKSTNESKKTEDLGRSNSEEEEEMKNENWDIFQNLLMMDADSSPTDMASKTMMVQEEHSAQNVLSLSKNFDKPRDDSDAFLPMGRSTEKGIEARKIQMEHEKDFRGVVKKNSNTNEEFLIPPRVERQNYSRMDHLGTESSIIKSHQNEDWIIGRQSEVAADLGGRIDNAILCVDPVSTHHSQMDKRERDILVDDSFMIQSRLSEFPLENKPAAQIFMVSEIAGANLSKQEQAKSLQVKDRNFYEPDDLCLIVGRGSVDQQATSSWHPETEYKNEKSLTQTGISEITSDIGRNTQTGKVPGRNMDKKATDSKAPRASLVRSKSDMASRMKISPSGSRTVRSKSEKEEEDRKKTEALQRQRQTRIAERSVAKGLSSETSNGRKKAAASTKTNHKSELKPPNEKNKQSQKTVVRSSTINRLATARTTNKQSTSEKKVSQDRKTTTKVGAKVATLSLKKTKGVLPGQNNIVHLHKKPGTNNSKGNNNSSDQAMLENMRKTKGSFLSKNSSEHSTTTKEHSTVTSFEQNEALMLSAKDASDDKNCNESLSDKDLVSRDIPSTQKNIIDDTRDNVPMITKSISEGKKLSFSPEISVVNFSTPPPTDGTVHSRKKWSDGESYSKVPKGIRKLLFFGRRI